MEAIFPNHLARSREAAGLTREELAQRAEVELRLYVELEDGRMLPTYDELELIRAQASRLGHTDAIVEQTQPIWSQWGMTRELAHQTARGMFDPAYRTTDSACTCGKAAGERCGDSEEHVISVDVLKGVAHPSH